MPDGFLTGCLPLDHAPLDHTPLAAQPRLAPSSADGSLLDRSLRLADDEEVVTQLAYVLRSWPRARGGKRGEDAIARVTAERLIDYLHLSGFELMKRPEAKDLGYVGGSR